MRWGYRDGTYHGGAVVCVDLPGNGDCENCPGEVPWCRILTRARLANKREIEMPCEELRTMVNGEFLELADRFLENPCAHECAISAVTNPIEVDGHADGGIYPGEPRGDRWLSRVSGK